MTRRATLFGGTVAAVLIAAGAAGLAIGPLSAPPRVPSIAEVRARHRPSELSLRDRHGEVVHELRTDPTRRRLAWTPLAEISPALRAAVLAAEDRRFASHGGVDARALASAAAERIAGKPARGASTVSMQLATMLDPALRRRGGPRSLAQKWRQMRLAWAIEARWSKGEILEAYLNLVSFRGELEGVRAAAGIAFGKAPHGITEPEAAVLAALLRAPNADRAAVIRRAVALAARAESRPPADAIEAAVSRALDRAQGVGPRVALAPHAAQQLLPAWGAGRADATDVTSTLDAATQRVAAETLRRHLSAVRERHVRDGAVLVVDNERGEVLAYVGGDPDLGSARHVSGIRARRQAGSTLKPFIYASAIDERLLTPASLLEDTPLEVAVAGGLYRPQNYDGEFKGLVSVRTALASSLNVPAVRALDLLGPEAAVGRLRRLGFEGLDEAGDFYGPSLALGSADVSLWELVGAYRALANGGVWSPLVMRARGAAEARPEAAARRVFSAEAAYLVGNVLADRESRSATFGLENPLATRFWTAVKTGTSKEMRDNWCVGYSRRYTVGVWVGNFSGEPMRNVSGVTGAAPIWIEVMSWLHRASPSAPPAPPDGVEARAVSFPAGGEPGRVEWFVGGTAPAESAVAGGGQARITSPVSGTVVALDPDIPGDRQRLVLEASGPVAGLRWQVDGRILGRGDELVVWEPVAGRHVAALVDAGHGVVDVVRFEVRGRIR